MLKIHQSHRIAALIAKNLSCGLEAREEQELGEWLAESEENRELYGKIMEPAYLGGQEKRRNSIDVRKHWERMGKELGKHPVRYSFQKYWRYAAVVLLLLGIGITEWWLDRRPAEILAQTEQIRPGKAKALLVLADGKTVELQGDRVEEQRLDCPGTVITDNAGGLRYNTDGTGTLAAVHHSLIIPKGGEYIMTLEDGTVVYLNSESKIEYPVQFTGKKREVCLEGEAYFKVAPREKLPFIVKTRHMDIKVSGTEFNVKAYADEKWVQATLVQGDVTVFTGEERMKQEHLQPAQQAKLDLEGGRLEVKQVDVTPFIAWKEGQFVFQGDHLEDIMTVLKRWYDFHVIYRDEWIKNIEFAGKINRSGSIDPILDVIRSTHKLNVDVKGKTIVFSAK